MRANLLIVLLAAAACGGGDEPAARPGTPPPAGAAAAAEPAGATDSAGSQAAPAESGQQAAAAQAAETQLVRETFTYTGAGRDPFVSLVMSGAVKPNPADLRIVGIAFDARYPQRSVATLRDRSDGTRYTLQAGDQVGRVRIQTIREREVVLLIEEFGLERQMVLTLSRRTQEVNP